MNSSKEAQPSKVSPKIASNDGPSNCQNRTLAEDAAAAAESARHYLEQMESSRLTTLVKARETAMGLNKLYPGGDHRFDDIDDEDEDEDEEDGWEDDEGSCGEMDEGGGESLTMGVLDKKMDKGPLAALKRAKEEYGFDLVGLIRRQQFTFLERVRIVNYMRYLVEKGNSAEDVVKKVEAITFGENGTEKKWAEDLSGESWLKPVVDGDPLLTVIDDVDEDNENVDETDITSVARNERNDFTKTQAKSEEEINVVACEIDRVLKPTS